MSVKVYKGLVLNVKDRKTGTAADGRFWCMFLAKNDKDPGSKDTISVFASNPEEAQFYTQARVGNIVDITKSGKKRPDGTWETRIGVTAHIEGMNETAVRDRDTYRAFAEQVQDAPKPTQDDFMDFTKAADFSSDALPFN